MRAQPCRLIDVDLTTPQTSVPNTRTSVCERFRRALYLLSTALAALPWHILAFLGSRALRENTRFMQEG